MIKPVFIALLVGLPLTAQEMKNYIFQLENGAEVLYQTYSEVSLPNEERAFGTASASGNVIRRTLTNGNGNPWAAFELHIDRDSSPGPVRFVLSVEPLGGWAFFKQKPASRKVQNGDRILLDVLQQPDTGRKLFDTFQVGQGVPMQIMPMPTSIPEIPGAGTQMRLQSPQFMKGVKAFAGSEGEISGSELALSIPGKGRFVLSSQPQPGFRMEGIADGTRVSFVAGSDLYEIQCSRPIIDSRAWYLWVRQETPRWGKSSVPMIELSTQQAR
jgi:hypothetical protein